MELKALLEFADDDGLLREDVLKKGGRKISKQLEKELGPGPYKMAQILTLLRNKSLDPNARHDDYSPRRDCTLNNNCAFSNYDADDDDDEDNGLINKKRIIHHRLAEPSYRTAEFDQLLSLMDAIEDNGASELTNVLDETDMDYILLKQEDKILQYLQPMLSNVMDEATVSAGPDQQLPNLLHDIFELIAKLCRNKYEFVYGVSRKRGENRRTRARACRGPGECKKI